VRFIVKYYVGCKYVKLRGAGAKRMISGDLGR
jgi:hypothetical protein